MAIFIALVSLHNQMKETGVKYSLDFCELNESYINMYFETSEVYDLEDVGKVRNVIQVSNDEIKREAFSESNVEEVKNDPKAYLLHEEEGKLRLVVFGDKNSKRSVSNVVQIVVE